MTDIGVVEINAAKNPNGTEVHLFREETSTKVLGYRVVVENTEKVLYISHLHPKFQAEIIFYKKCNNGALIRQ